MSQGLSQRSQQPCSAASSGNQLSVLPDMAIDLLQNCGDFHPKVAILVQNHLVTLSVSKVHFYFFRLRLWSRIFTSKNSNTNLLKNDRNYNCLDAEEMFQRQDQGCRKWIELNCLPNFLDFVFVGTTEWIASKMTGMDLFHHWNFKNGTNWSYWYQDLKVQLKELWV